MASISLGQGWYLCRDTGFPRDAPPRVKGELVRRRLDDQRHHGLETLRDALANDPDFDPIKLGAPAAVAWKLTTDTKGS